MTLTVDASATIQARIRREPEFASALLDEAIVLFVNGEPDVARIVLRDLVNGTIGFEGLAAATGKPSKSLHRMLSAKGNPTMDSLTMIFGALRQELQVEIQVQSVACA
jgi:DNA-binding phage protein